MFKPNTGYAKERSHKKYQIKARKIQSSMSSRGMRLNSRANNTNYSSQLNLVQKQPLKDQFPLEGTSNNPSISIHSNSLNRIP